MNTKLKKGFSLPEAMVVAVILGVLSAITVPKLFGGVAKAKATEIPLAASTYKKMQDAAIAAHGSAGNWKTIGYISPGTKGVSNHFEYSEGEITTDKYDLEDLGEGKVGWQATNKSNLQGCAAKNWWTIRLTKSKSLAVNYGSLVSSGKCSGLAKDFVEGNTTGVGSTVAGGSSLSETFVSKASYSGQSENNSGDTGNDSSNSKKNTASTNILADGSAIVKFGGWNGDGFRNSADKDAGMVNGKDGIANGVLYTYNTGSTEEGKEGLYKLEPNSTYTFTMTDPEAADGVWKSSEWLQTDIRIYTENNFSAKGSSSGAAAVMCGTTQKSEADRTADAAQNGIWATTGSNTSTSAKASQGFDAVGTYDPETKTTTFTITTGNEVSYFGANIRANGSNTGFKTTSTEANDVARINAAQNSVTNATLTKTGTSDGTKTAAQIAAENKES